MGGGGQSLQPEVCVYWEVKPADNTGTHISCPPTPTPPPVSMATCASVLEAFCRGREGPVMNHVSACSFRQTWLPRGCIFRGIWSFHPRAVQTCRDFRNWRPSEPWSIVGTSGRYKTYVTRRWCVSSKHHRHSHSKTHHCLPGFTFYDHREDLTSCRSWLARGTPVFIFVRTY